MSTQNYNSVEQVRSAFRRLYRSDPESNLGATLSRVLSDPLRPVDERGRRKPNPLFVLILALVCALMSVFLYFSLGGAR
jgi:hypothetical protein